MIIEVNSGFYVVIYLLIFITMYSRSHSRKWGRERAGRESVCGYITSFFTENHLPPSHFQELQPLILQQFLAICTHIFFIYFTVDDYVFPQIPVFVAFNKVRISVISPETCSAMLFSSVSLFLYLFREYQILQTLLYLTMP